MLLPMRALNALKLMHYACTRKPIYIYLIYIQTEKYYESVTVQGLFQVSPKGRGTNGCGHDLKGEMGVMT